MRTVRKKGLLPVLALLFVTGVSLLLQSFLNGDRGYRPDLGSSCSP